MPRKIAKAPAGGDGGALEPVSCLVASDGFKHNLSPAAELRQLGEKNFQLERTRAYAAHDISDELAFTGAIFTLWLRSEVSLPSFRNKIPTVGDHQRCLAIIRVAKKDPIVCNTLIRLLVNEQAL